MVTSRPIYYTVPYVMLILSRVHMLSLRCGSMSLSLTQAHRLLLKPGSFDGETRRDFDLELELEFEAVRLVTERGVSVAKAAAAKVDRCR